MGETVFVLKDPSGTGQVLRVRAKANGGFLEIMPDGFGEAEACDGQGAPVLLDFFGGELRVHVKADINQVDPTHSVDLSGAHETRRNQE